MEPGLSQRLEAIEGELRSFGRLVVAFSGGVDSTLVAALAQRALGDGAVAVTAVSETLGQRELASARRVAREVGIRHELMSFSELADERFVANTPQRCFYCQSMRFDHLTALCEKLDVERVASGTNLDDLGEHRPGLEAMRERRVYQPLLLHRLTKAEVREAARSLGLSVWDKPAKACLSSRIPHGLRVSNERLRRIESAEDALADLGFEQVRVRDHSGYARVEVSPRELARALERRAVIWERLSSFGFEGVGIDLRGYRAGSLSPE